MSGKHVFGLREAVVIAMIGIAISVVVALAYS